MKNNKTHTRPTSFSDPYNDFTQELLSKILDTPDSLLSRYQFQCILGPHLPAGTYHETIYFFPLACEYILAHDEDALDLITPIVGYIANNHDKLEQDNLLDYSLEQIKKCLSQWTAEFKVCHYDKEGCRKKGWGLTYFNYVSCSETIAEATCDLISFNKHANLAIEFYQKISSIDATPSQAAWFLELVSQHIQDEPYKPPNYPGITELLEDQAIADRSALLVANELPSFNEHLSYWRDTFNALGTSSVYITPQDKVIKPTSFNS